MGSAIKPASEPGNSGGTVNCVDFVEFVWMYQDGSGGASPVIRAVVRTSVAVAERVLPNAAGAGGGAGGPALEAVGAGDGAGATLLGDAAHAATPNLGQGACQALEDAVVLAHCLRAEQPVDAALRAYERLRIPRTAAIVNNSRRTGRILQLDQPALEWLRNSVSASPLGRRMERRLFRQLLFYPLPKL